MTRLFRYILVTDSGMAPCIDEGLLTLALCKPGIRKSAKAGDWVAGFMPRPHDRGLLVYAARIERRLPIGEFERRYRGRSDAIYRERDDGCLEPLSEFHAADHLRKRDVSSDVLIFDRDSSWYFGNSPQSLPKCMAKLAAAGQGFRVNGPSEDDITALEKWLRSNWKTGIHTQPRHPKPQDAVPLLAGTRRSGCA